MADSYTKWAAESHYDPVDRVYLREASLTHLKRKTAEARSHRTREWIEDHVKSERRYRLPKGGRISHDLRKEGKGGPAGSSSSSQDTQRLDRISR